MRLADSAFPRHHEQRWTLDIKGLAALLCVDSRHVQRLVTEKRIPYIKWGHYIRFDPAEIRRWLDEYRCGVERR